MVTPTLITETDLRRCARAGMTKAEVARHLDVSRAAVTKSASLYDVPFSRVPFEFKRLCKRHVPLGYQPDQVEVGDWFEPPSIARLFVLRANRRYPDRRFEGCEVGYANRVVRVE